LEDRNFNHFAHDRYREQLSATAEQGSQYDTGKAPPFWPRTWWINAVLFLLTLISTTVFGYALQLGFARGHVLDDEAIGLSYVRMLHADARVWTGLVYSIPLLLILLAHEFGHYFSCRYWRVRATLPYFGPSPTLLGTIGAFIWIRSPIYRRRSLFDIGVSGPICGFIVLLPFLVAGVWNSKVCQAAPAAGDVFSFGTPLILWLMEQWRFPGFSHANICLHPMAVAAWAGLLATAVNLLPVGQLDGGHILYSAFGERGHFYVSRVLVALLAFAGFLYWPWWVWAVILFFFRRHPLIYDQERLGPVRSVIGVAALLMLVLCFSVVPVRIH
jgi:membrane-associated protease RseP (regulator of RpoE activity)